MTKKKAARTRLPNVRKEPTAADWRKRSQRIPMDAYTRPWDCPDCKSQVHVSYEDLLNHRKDAAAYDILFLCVECGAKLWEPVTFEEGDDG